MTKQRINKLIAAAGVASRRAADELILAGKVTINGKPIIELGTMVDTQRDQVIVDGKILESEKKVYILLHKPKGVLSTCGKEDDRETVLDYTKDITERIFPVGRLDYNTEGALLLTNDGELANRLIHPRYKVEKTYLARLDSIPTEAQLAELRSGVVIDDKITQPAQVALLDCDPTRLQSEVEITIREGRNRQVRNMFEAIGARVRSLTRTHFAFLTLQGVRRGQYRRLRATEINRLFDLTGIEYERTVEKKHADKPFSSDKTAQKDARENTDNYKKRRTANETKRVAKPVAKTTPPVPGFSKFIKKPTKSHE